MKYLVTALMILGFWASSARAEENESDFVPTIEGFECVGNTRTLCEIITSEVELSVGDKLQEEELTNAQIRLGLTGLFRDVQFSLKKGSQKNLVIVVVQVEEASPFYFKTSLMGSKFEFEPSITFSDLNFLGRGKILSATLSQSYWARNDNLLDANYLESESVNVKYEDPHLFGSKRLFAKLDAGYKKDKILDARELSLNGELGYRVFNFSYVSLLLNYGESRYSDEYFGLQGYNLNSRVWQNGYGLAYGWEDTNDRFLPTEGTSFRFESRVHNYQNVAWWSSHYLVNEISYAYFQPLKKNHTLKWLGSFYSRSTSDSSAYSVYMGSLGAFYLYDFRRGSYMNDLSDVRFKFGVQYGCSYFSSDSYARFGPPSMFLGVTFNSQTLGTVDIGLTGNTLFGINRI